MATLISEHWECTRQRIGRKLYVRKSHVWYDLGPRPFQMLKIPITIFYQSSFLSYGKYMLSPGAKLWFFTVVSSAIHLHALVKPENVHIPFYKCINLLDEPVGELERESNLPVFYASSFNTERLSLVGFSSSACKRKS